MKFDNTKYPRLAIRISEETRMALEQLAIANNMTIGKLVKSFIDVGISLQHRKEKAKS